MNYENPLIEGVLLRRYKRFLADVRLPDGTEVVAHCPNPGSMKGCTAPDAPCRVSRSDNPKRKLAYTLEQVCVQGVWIMVHTGRPNAVVAEGIAQGHFPTLAGYPVLQREKRYGRQNSRIDILLLDEDGAEHGSEEAKKPRAFVEVKNATLVEGDRILFPDSVTKRGLKHLEELMEVVQQGDRGVLLFHVGRSDGRTVGPADAIDPAYGARLREAAAAGVEVMAVRCAVSAHGLELAELVPVDLKR